jgi:hypothetical protein
LESSLVETCDEQLPSSSIISSNSFKENKPENKPKIRARKKKEKAAAGDGAIKRTERIQRTALFYH